MQWRTIGMAIVLSAGLVACSSGGSPTVESNGTSAATSAANETTSTATGSTASESARQYVASITSPDVATSTRAAEVAAPGSPAASYAAFALAQSKALSESGRSTPEPTLEPSDDGSIRACFETGGSSKCYSFGDFAFDPDGLVVTMSIDGAPIDGRTVAPSDQPVPAPDGTARMAGAVGSNDGTRLKVAVELTGGTDGMEINAPASTYLSPDKLNLPVSIDLSVMPPSTTAPGQSSHVILGFADAKPGGTLLLWLCRSGSSDCRRVSLEVA